MYSSSKSPKGSVGVEVCNGSLRLRLPRQLYGGKQKYFSLALADTKENRKIAEVKAHKIYSDIVTDNFDYTLNKYRDGHLRVVEDNKDSQLNKLSVIEIFDKFIEHRKPEWEIKTIDQYKTFRNHIASIPYKSLEQWYLIKEHIRYNISPDTGKRLLSRLSTACNWAIEAGLVTHNPFKDTQKEIKLPQKDEEDRKTFTKAERDIIIEAYQNHNIYKLKYASLVKFLFLTGCRHEEAIGLRWKYISDNLSFITFKEVIVFNGKSHQKSTTKTGKSRKFPINAQLREFLESIKPPSPNPDDLVFSLGNNEPINHGHFSRSWRGGNNGKKKYRGIVTELVKQGKVSEYLTPNSTRHTYISLAAQAGAKSQDLALWVGNTQKVIEQYYMDTPHNIIPPEV